VSTGSINTTASPWPILIVGSKPICANPKRLPPGLRPRMRSRPVILLLIPGENDSDGELDQMTLWIVENLCSDVPLHFTAFHPDWKMLDKPHTPPATLTRARRIALANGLHYVYTGNVHDAEGGSTYCPHCGTRVIERGLAHELEGAVHLDYRADGVVCTINFPAPNGSRDG